ncbi:hypothetical protein HMPREF0658_1968 [Hoylesella marshii DSM 16973 = JCM 13450]|uniref:Uncharacterized protein n=1 Tax=Hoylesella marshii DSM 16973 = JCM 13450 TaxID=862515 RepID=E0NUW3_9BACT|nr:hypothetical protein HMPREF0658_1968 [Hoylesella marshii DSM 16973 = JCM 13450]
MLLLPIRVLAFIGRIRKTSRRLARSDKNTYFRNRNQILLL